jgi:hypothetical protein
LISANVKQFTFAYRTLSYRLLRIRTWEAAMPGSSGKSGETDKSSYLRWVIGFVVLPALLVIAMVGLIMTHQAASSGVSEAAQTEFPGTHLLPKVAPTQLMQPAREIRTVGGN